MRVVPSALFLLVIGTQTITATSTRTQQFEILMQALADGWNQGNAQKASDCFTEDAVYSEPPEKQLYRGRAALFKFFGGTEGRKRTMKMTWHHLIFNERTQIGAGEFTFDYGGTVHGVAMVKVKNGKISNWREYWYESPLDWKSFTRSNPF
jgi:ketosteroid isomerase-like protein